MAGILTFALHYEGQINKNSLGAVSEAAKRAKDIGAEAHAVVVGENVSDDLAKSLGKYGATKVWGEALARVYADSHGMSMICLRIGRVRAEDKPMAPREFSVWCSQRDIVRMLEACIEAPERVRFDVFYVVSANRWSYRDLEHARAVLGWTPLDRAEDHR